MPACAYAAMKPQTTKTALQRSMATMLAVTRKASTEAAGAGCARTGYSEEKKLQLAVKRYA